jgi:class 3 adenylate cyclase
VWGDTVNLASRLQEHAGPGLVLVSESTAEELTDRYEFGPSESIDVKGKGPTPVRVLRGRLSAPIAEPLPSEVE